jgi:predicted RNase H-like HicB family nuclease
MNRKAHIFSILLDPDTEEGGYTVTVPALPGCITEGDSYEEALAMAKEAIGVHLRGLQRDGELIPEETGELRLATVEVELEDAPITH